MPALWNNTRRTNKNLSPGITRPAHQTKNTLADEPGSCWSRQQKLAMIACFAILLILLAVSACSKQSQKTALVGVSTPAPSSAASSGAIAQQIAAPQTAANMAPAPQPAAKKVAKKRAVNVSYTDANSGVSFSYPRKFALATGDKAQPQLDDDVVPMNFIQPGGATVATVVMPKSEYPGTDFASGFFSVNVNRSLSEEQCSHFAFVDTRDPDGEPVDAEKVKVGSTDMEMTSEFAGSATKQEEAEYYHNYENGACYEYVLGLGTAGYGTADGIKAVDRNEVFTRLGKILATVKLRPAAHEEAQKQLAPGAVAGGDSGK